MVMADLRAAEAAEKFLRHIRAGTIRAIRLFVVDAAHFKARVQAIPASGFIGVHNRSRLDARLDPVDRRAFRGEHREAIGVKELRL